MKHLDVANVHRLEDDDEDNYVCPALEYRNQKHLRAKIEDDQRRRIIKMRWRVVCLGVAILVLAVVRITPFHTVTIVKQGDESVRVEKEWGNIISFALGKNPRWKTVLYPSGVTIEGPIKDGREWGRKMEHGIEILERSREPQE